MIRNKRNKALKLTQGAKPYELGAKETKTFGETVDRFFVYKFPLDVETLSKEEATEISAAEKEARDTVMAKIDAEKKKIAKDND